MLLLSKGFNLILITAVTAILMLGGFMHFVYIDDAKDDDQQARRLCSFAALLIPENNWQDALRMVKEFRHKLKCDYGMYVNKELHACEFVAGRGNIADRIVTKSQRGQIFSEALKLTANLPGAKLLPAVGAKNHQLMLFERLLNRINKNVEKVGDHAVLFCDEGNNIEYTRLRRKMGVHNPIQSRYGSWKDTGANWKNIPLNFILEDPVFKDSKQSYFIQLADFASFALLRQENQIPSRNKYGIHIAFDALNSILVREAFYKDARGIIRDN